MVFFAKFDNYRVVDFKLESMKYEACSKRKGRLLFIISILVD